MSRLRSKDVGVNDMRLIDGNRLVKETMPQYKELMGTDIGHGMGIMLAEISAAPTIDAVPVVRCKDCVNGTVFVNKQGAEYVDCVLDDYSVRKPTDYCSYGERKDGEG